MLSGKYGTISTGRVLSSVFGAFTIIMMALVVRKMLGISDPALLHECVASPPASGGVLFGLVGLPCSATKVTGNRGRYRGASERAGVMRQRSLVV